MLSAGDVAPKVAKCNIDYTGTKCVSAMLTNPQKL